MYQKSLITLLLIPFTIPLYGQVPSQFYDMDVINSNPELIQGRRSFSIEQPEEASYFYDFDQPIVETENAESTVDEPVPFSGTSFSQMSKKLAQPVRDENEEFFRLLNTPSEPESRQVNEIRNTIEEESAPIQYFYDF